MTQLTLKDVIIRTFIKNAILDYLNNVRKDRTKMQFLTGYKTYIMAGVLLALAGLHVVGIDIPNIPAVDPTLAITTALGLIFARNGAKTEVTKAIAPK